MKGFVADIEELTDDNADYRRVLYTGSHLQLVLMSLAPGEEIGEEVHKSGDQFFRVEKGKGEPTRRSASSLKAYAARSSSPHGSSQFSMTSTMMPVAGVMR